MATQSYLFRVSDILTSITEHGFRFVELDPTTKKYVFVFIPINEYSSVLMLDYLLASRQNKKPSSLMELVGQAVREDLRGVSDFLVFGGPEGVPSVFTDIPMPGDIEPFKTTLANIGLQATEKMYVIEKSDFLYSVRERHVVDKTLLFLSEKERHDIEKADFIYGVKKLHDIEKADFIYGVKKLHDIEKAEFLYSTREQHSAEEYIILGGDKGPQGATSTGLSYGWKLKEADLNDKINLLGGTKGTQGATSSEHSQGERLKERQGAEESSTLGGVEEQSAVNMYLNYHGWKTTEADLLEPSFAGVRDRVDALLSHGLAGTAPDSRDGVLQFGFESIRQLIKAAEAEYNPILADIDNERVSHLEGGGTYGDRDNLQPAELSVEHQMGETEATTSVINRDVLHGQSDPQTATIQEEHPQGHREELMPATIDDSTVYGDGTQPRPSTGPEQTYEGTTEPQQTYLNSNHTMASETARAGTEYNLMKLADIQDKLSSLATGYMLAQNVTDRIAHLEQIHSLGVRTYQEGILPERDYLRTASLAIDKGIIQEQLFAVSPERATHLIDQIVATVAPIPSQMPSDFKATLSMQNPAVIDSLVGADKSEHYVDVITSVVGSRILAEAIIEQYDLAHKVLEGEMLDSILGTQKLKESYMDKINDTAQGLLYDPSRDVLEDGMEPEHWQGGYAVPTDYDPHDPFNSYYPYYKELDPYTLSKEDWELFGEGEWTKDSEHLEFTVGSSDHMGGYFYNNFDHTSYVFDTEFRVGGAGDSPVGVVMKYVDEQNYVSFGIRGDGASATIMQLNKVKNGVTTNMGSAMNPFVWEQGKVYHVELSVLDNRIRIKVNGRLQYDLYDN